MVFPANGAILFFGMQSIMGWRTTHPCYYLLRSIIVLNTCGQVFLPEAELAKQWGKMANEKYGLIFYFPSDKEPDNNCLGWEQPHLAILCADCAKMIIPTYSPYLSKEICYSCHLKREFNNKIKNAEPYDDGVNLYMVKDEEYNHLGYSSFLDGFPIAPFIDDTVQSRREKRLVDIVTIDELDISIIKEKIEQALDEKVAVYKSAEFPPDFPEKFKSNIKRHTVEYKGNKVALTLFNITR